MPSPHDRPPTAEPAPSIHSPMAAALLEQQTFILEELRAMRGTIDAHIAEEGAALRALVAALPTLPDGTPDTTGHRNYHAAKITAARDFAEIVRDVKRDLAKGTIKGLAAAVVFLFLFWLSTVNGLPRP